MIVASLIGGVVVGLVTVICVLVVNRGESTQSQTIATSGTATRITTEGEDSETTHTSLETTKSPKFTILPVFRVRMIECKPKASLRSKKGVVGLAIEVSCTEKNKEKG